MTAGPLCEALCIGAHPDDVEIGMGGTVAKLVREGARVVIVDLTNGEPTPLGTPEKRASGVRACGGGSRRGASNARRSPTATSSTRSRHASSWPRS